MSDHTLEGLRSLSVKLWDSLYYTLPLNEAELETLRSGTQPSRPPWTLALESTAEGERWVWYLKPPRDK